MNASILKKTLLAGTASLSVVLFSMAQPALAQDAENPFEGAYIGVHAGRGYSSPTFSSDPYIANLSEAVPIGPRSDEFDLDGRLFGLQAGYNFIEDNRYLFGIEGDWSSLGGRDFTTFSQSITTNGEDFHFSHRSELELDWQASIRGRLGYVYDQKTMFFGTAGVAFLNVDWKETATVDDTQISQILVQNHSKSETLTGFVIGAGAEYAVTENIILGIDYLYESFGDMSVPFGHNDPAEFGVLSDIDVHKIRLKLNYMF